VAAVGRTSQSNKRITVKTSSTRLLAYGTSAERYERPIPLDIAITDRDRRTPAAYRSQCRIPSA
jgi:hypothetical protein